MALSPGGKKGALVARPARCLLRARGRASHGVGVRLRRAGSRGEQLWRLADDGSFGFIAAGRPEESAERLHVPLSPRTLGIIGGAAGTDRWGRRRTLPRFSVAPSPSCVQAHAEGEGSPE